MMTLSVLTYDGRPYDVEQPGREHASDDDALLSFLALQMMTAPSGGYLVTSTDARGQVEAQIGLQVAAPGREVGEHGEQYAWSSPPTGAWQTSRQLRQARERLVLSVRQHAERAAFEDTGELPHRMPPHPDRVAWAAERAAAGSHDAASDARAAGQLAHDLLDGYRPRPAPKPGEPRPVTGSDEAHLAEHFEQLASLDRHTSGERRTAALLALGGRIGAHTEVVRESGDTAAEQLDRIATALETLVSFEENRPTRRASLWRRVWAHLVP